MKSFRVLGFAGALLLGVSAAGAASAQACNRACLDGVLNQYLAAVVKHDTNLAPLAGGFRQTDNAIATLPGSGVWQSITALGKVQQHYIDTTNQAVGFHGTVLEGDKGAIVTLRLAVENRKITEAEWIIGRLDEGTPTSGGPGATSIEGAELTPPPKRIVPNAERVSRRELIAAANAYFDSVPINDERLMPAIDQWVRLENGIGTGKGPGGWSRQGGMFKGRAAQAAAGGPVQGGVLAAGAAGTAQICGGICNVAARRYPIVDEEQQAVLGIVVFQRPPANVNRRNLLSEWFHLDHGKITGIYAAMHYPNPTIPVPNWAPYDGNFPLSFNVGISPNPNPPGSTVASIAAAAAAPPAPPAMPPIPLSVDKLNNRVYRLPGPSTSNNSVNGVIVGDKGVILFDTKNTLDDEKAVLAEVAKITNKPVTTVFISHSDGDHINGLGALPKGVQIISHIQSAETMRKSAAAGGPRAANPDYLPTKTIDQREVMTVNGVKVQALHYTPAHIAGDLILYLPDDKIVFMGDIVISEIDEPFMHMENGGSPEGAIKSIDAMIALDANLYVSGHGPVVTKGELVRRVALYKAKMDKVRPMIAAGKTPAEIKAAVGEPPAPPAGQPRRGLPTLTDYMIQEAARKPS